MEKCSLYRWLDLSDSERDNAPLPPPPPTSASNSETHQQAINYSSLAATAAAVKSSVSEPDQSISSTETLLRNIQSLLTVAADNARQQERQISYEKGKHSHTHILAISKSLTFFSLHVATDIDSYIPTRASVCAKRKAVGSFAPLVPCKSVYMEARARADVIFPELKWIR